MALYKMARRRLSPWEAILRVFSGPAYTTSLYRESFLNTTSAPYIEDLYRLWQEDPSGVHSSWDSYFRRISDEVGPGGINQASPITTPTTAASMTSPPTTQTMGSYSPGGAYQVPHTTSPSSVVSMTSPPTIQSMGSYLTYSPGGANQAALITTPTAVASMTSPPTVQTMGSYLTYSQGGANQAPPTATPTSPSMTSSTAKETKGSYFPYSKPVEHPRSTTTPSSNAATLRSYTRSTTVSYLDFHPPTSTKGTQSMATYRSSPPSTILPSMVTGKGGVHKTPPVPTSQAKPIPWVSQQQTISPMMAAGQGEAKGIEASKTLAPSKSAQQPGSNAPSGEKSDVVRTIKEHMQVQRIIRAYQSRGHLVAECDPLGLQYAVLDSKFKERKGIPTKLVVRGHMIDDEKAMDTVYILPRSTFIGGKEEESLTLREILKRLENVYCHHMGLEFRYITSLAKTQWLMRKFETPGAMVIDNDRKKVIFKRLVEATGFEAFLARKFANEKRFGLEGCEALIPALMEIVDLSAAQGVESFIIGMPHRGRLNVISNVCKQPLEKLFTQFAGLDSPGAAMGDVKYHLGLSVERFNNTAKKNIRVSIVANPSHLECVNPVVHGKCRAEQFYRGDKTGKEVLGILMHGDASFCGQGVVFESFNMSNLADYTTRGTIHLVVNNQVGFTTDPRYSRSSPYCTDVGRTTEAPIFHVNADDPEAVIYCCRVAAEYRHKFRKDVVIDLVCYRRSGHNEIDEPSFTQPLMYKLIRAKPNVLTLYSEKLVKEGVVTQAEVTKEQNEYDALCEKEFEKAQKITACNWSDWLDSPWPKFFKNRDPMKIEPTGVDMATLEHIGGMFAAFPPKSLKFEIHKGLIRVFKQRQQMVHDKQADWAMGEALAFGSLLKERIHVRLSGQDVERGTFSHRHHVLHHQTRDKEFYVPLKHLYPGEQAEYLVCNSAISEMAVLGFEIGYSLTNPNSLILWEAQFGDFNNGAQIIIDTYLASGEVKWIRQCGLVMLNPHGSEGMGPEHSSGRVERFLKLCDDDPDVMPDLKDPNLVVKPLRENNQ